MNKLSKMIMPLLVMVALGGAPVVMAKAKAPERPQTREQVEMALEFVDKLLTSSSLSRHIEKTNFAPAIAYLNEARRLRSQAVVSLEKDNLVLAIAKRDEAIRLAFEAGHLSQMASAREEKPQKDYEDRLRSIEALRKAHASIAHKAKRPELAGMLEAEIKDDLAAADTLRAKGEYRQGRADLDKAYLKIRAAVDRLRGGQTLGELSGVTTASSPLQSDYESKLRSIHALLDAQQRIADEKSSIEQKAAIKKTITALLNSAHDYAKSDNYQQALQTVNQAYAMITESIEKMRGGDTLVRTLRFETPEEEYHYELDRNDTYKMLIRMLVEEKKTMQLTGRVEEFLDQAKALRKLGERQAQGGDFKEAIKSLEQSTRNLIFAMRNAGFFVPG